MVSIRCNSWIKLWRNKKHPKILIKTKLFINKYNWEVTNFPSETNDWEISLKNNVTIALNDLYTETEKVYPLYVSKYNSNLKEQVISLMISNGEIRDQLEIWAMKAMSKDPKTKFEV